MKRLLPLIWILLLFSTFSFGQPWSNILASSRAINWSNAGLPATLPDGETTPNPWTPPTRTQCGSTISSGASPATINAAIAACSPGTYVLLGPGSFTFSSANLDLFGPNSSGNPINGVTLRGSGAQGTKILLSGTAQIQFGRAYGSGSCTWASGYSAGTTSITVNSCSGVTLVPGDIIELQQCDSGYSGSGCTGSASDNGGIYVCGYNQGVCNTDTNQPGASHKWQQQTVYVTGVTSNGGGAYSVTFTPGIYMPNWSSGNTPTIGWVTPGGSVAETYGAGLEDVTVDMSAGLAINVGIAITNTYASWVKGVRIIGLGEYGVALYMESAKNSLFANNYLYGTSSVNGVVFIMQEGTDSDDLVINNTATGGTFWQGTGSTEGNVLAYNYTRDAQSSAYFNRLYQHEPGSAFMLYEGNEVGQVEDDDTWGTHDLNTWFRNYVSGQDPPFVTGDPQGFQFDSFARFENVVGNAIGSAPLTNYQSTYSSPESDYVFGLNVSFNDTLMQSSLMRWGNCDTVTGTCRFQSSEVPTTLAGNAARFNITIPSNNNLPCSFFLVGHTSTPCTPVTSGGTGLNWWKVCTTWTTFPTSCAVSQAQPFPIAGPDITGGPYVNGHGYDNPAAIAFQNLPIDTSYQNSYNITSSSWSSGTETLTVSGLPSSSSHIIGGFQITEASGCNSPAGGEFVMTSSTSTTVSYALASNPGSCAGGTMKFPDIRQFDERVYGNDSSGDPSPPAPTGLTAVVH
jgi:hypothetical protein